MQCERLLISIAPNSDRLPEVRRIVEISIHPDQSIDIFRIIQTLQKALPGSIKIRRILLQGETCQTIAQRHLQRFAGLPQMLRIAVGGVTVQLVCCGLLGFRPMTLADDVCGGAGLQLEHGSRQQNGKRGKRNQRCELELQHAQQSRTVSGTVPDLASVVFARRFAHLGHPTPLSRIDTSPEHPLFQAAKPGMLRTWILREMYKLQ